MLALVESCEGYEQAVRLLLSTVERQMADWQPEETDSAQLEASQSALRALLGALETATEAAATLDALTA